MSDYMTRKEHLRIRKEDLNRINEIERQLDEARYSATDYAMKLGRANEKLAEARESYVIIWLNELSLDIITLMYGNNVNLNNVFYGLLEDQGFIDGIEAFLHDENLELGDSGLELKISSLSKQEGQMSHPETGQWDFPPYWECDIELHKNCN